jgi:uncharacterized tellurite resistance protein B-like protein
MLGTLVTILWLLYRLAEMGIDLGGLNPFLWQRRRKWKQHYDANPVFKLDNPMEATALLITAVAKADGDMSSEEKHAILDIFEHEFHLSKRDAAGLLISSTHLLGKGEEVRNNLKEVLSPSVGRFSADQASSALELIRRIAATGGSATEMQQELIEKTSAILERQCEPKRKWEPVT